MKATDTGQMAAASRCTEDFTCTTMEPHQRVKRHPLPVHRILYPPYCNSSQTELFGLTNQADQIASRSSDEDGALGMSQRFPQKQRYSARGIPNAVMAAISTAKVVAKANRATRRPTHSSESDISSVGELNWNETLHRFPVALSRSDHLNTEPGKPINCKTSSQPMRTSSVHNRTIATVASLPSVREHQVEIISSEPTQNILQMQLVDPIVPEVHHRNDSFCSDADGSVSTASSVGSGANRDLPSQKTRHSNSRSLANIWHCQRPLSLTGPECHQNQYLKHLSGSLLSHVTPLGQTHRRGSLSQSTQSGCVSGVRPSLMTASSRQRTLSTFYPGRFQKTCEFTGNASFLAVTAGRRRWIFVRPHDEHGNPIVTHRILSGSCSWDFVNQTEVANSLCNVWAAYFNLLRTRQNHSAPGGPFAPTGNLGLAGFDSARCLSVPMNSASGATTDHGWPTSAYAGRILPKPMPKSNGLAPEFESSSGACPSDVQRLLRCVEIFNNRTPSLVHFTSGCKMDDPTTACVVGSVRKEDMQIPECRMTPDTGDLLLTLDKNGEAGFVRHLFILLYV
ncbi:hypothetical protein P879_06837 [Paragonimus westermani]|uniref:Uncharacterized protein n=1 Tax=Paragonimus westermani TaxID=34504 RepID=A0A8T0DJJ6_9TREM|nr:hypothetical protein P879_06837 [Paragonimus westermani]